MAAFVLLKDGKIVFLLSRRKTKSIKNMMEDPW